MSIIMTVAGILVGAIIGAHLQWRSDVAKHRQQLESETPYDYALTNARADNERFRKELVTIQATKQIEADTERIRNEIDTLLSDDGEEPSEGMYEEDKRRLDIEDAGKRWESNLRALYGDWEIPRIDEPTSDGRGYIPIQQHDDGTISPILPQSGELDTSPMVAITGMNTEEAAWDAGAVARAYGGNVSEVALEREIGTDPEDSFKKLHERFKEAETKRIHKISTGDTLTSIAKEYGTTGDELIKLNSIRRSRDFADGNILIIPEEDVE